LFQGVNTAELGQAREVSRMLTSLITKDFNCLASYALEAVTSVSLDKLKQFFVDLPVDPYLEGNYRFRRLSHFQVSNDRLIKLPHSRLFQPKEYNPLLGDVVREYPELDDKLIALKDFQRIALEFFEFCKLCSTFNEIGVHQIRTTATYQQVGNPAPEGIHRDGVDLVGIFCVSRDRIEEGETHLYKSKNDSPVFAKILNPGELLVFGDRQFLHFTSSIKAISAKGGARDAFVFTCPGLIPSDR
jgi:hypothetical protein